MVFRVESLEGGVQVWTLDRPPANAINAEVVDALGSLVDEAARNTAVRAILLRGTERFFSGGLDLKEMGGGGASRMAQFGYRDGIFKLWTLPKPTVAEIGGHAIAGGAILALACDFRITRRGAHKLGLNETAIGLAFPRGAYEIARLGLAPTELGPALLAGELVGVDRARVLGYVHEVVEPETLSAHCLALARKLAAYPAQAYAYNKELIQHDAVARCDAQSKDELERLFAIWTSEETMNAFMSRASAVSQKK